MADQSEWVISGKALDGVWEELSVAASSHQEISGDLARSLVEDLFSGTPPRTIKYLIDELSVAREFDSSLPGLDGVKTWGRSLASQIDNNLGFRFDDDDGYLSYLQDRYRRRGRGLWDAQTLVAIRIPHGFEQIHVEYTPDSRTLQRDLRISSQFSGVATTYFEWRGYFGSNSAVIHGFQQLKAGLRETCEIACGAAGFVLGTITRVAGEGRFAPTSTAVFDALQLRDRDHWIATDIPDLRGKNIPTGPTSVLVHGTYSTCSSAFNDIPKSILKNRAVIRYEHDTFQSIQDNASELADLIINKLGSDVLLVAHSRGGLVARLAMLKLEKFGYNGIRNRVRLITCGTPHAGTPIAQSAMSILPVLNPLVSMFAPRSGLLSAAIERFRVGKATPVGIADMVPQSTFIATLNDGDFEAENLIMAFGGDFSIDASGHGYGPAFKGKFGDAAFKEANDLVVPLSSALSYGGNSQKERLECSHFGFFSEKEVLSLLNHVMY